MNNANALYRQGRFSEARAAYREELKRDPTSSTAREQLGTIALWENQCDEAERYFHDARRYRPWYARRWPLDAQLSYRLALSHYRKNCFAEAASCLRQAAGPLALGPFRELRAFAAQMALFGDESPYAIEGPDETRVAFVRSDPLPVVEAAVNGGDPLCFLIDTGGAEVILDRSLVGRCGAEISSSLSTSYAGQKKAATGLGRIGSLRLGEIEIRNLPIHTLDTLAMSSLFDGIDVSGILGTRLLMHFLSTIDYAGGALVLRRRGSASEQHHVAGLGRSDAKVIPFWLAETHYMLAWGTINQLEPMLFFVDTGLAGSAFTATEPVLRQAGISLDWSQARPGIGGAGAVKGVGFVADRLTLGTGADEVVERDLPGTAIAGSVAILGDRLGFRIDGLISHQFFRQYALTLDFERMKLVLRR